MKDSEKINEDVPEIPTEVGKDSNRAFIPKIPFFLKAPSDQNILSTLASPRKENMRMLNHENSIIQEISNFKKVDESCSIESPSYRKKTTIIPNNGLNELVYFFIYLFSFSFSQIKLNSKQTTNIFTEEQLKLLSKMVGNCQSSKIRSYKESIVYYPFFFVKHYFLDIRKLIIFVQIKFSFSKKMHCSSFK